MAACLSVPGEKMHPDELDIDASLVAGLIAAQFPQYRLAENMVVRLPRITRAADQVDTEQRWLPRLAPHLPLQVPVPLGLGAPGEGFPMPWSVYA